jgi:hypothetical protein
MSDIASTATDNLDSKRDKICTYLMTIIIKNNHLSLLINRYNNRFHSLSRQFSEWIFAIPSSISSVDI